MGSVNSALNSFAVTVGLKTQQARALFLGLDAAGKTTALYKMKTGHVETTIPTIGFNIETLALQNLDLNVWDIGVRDKGRPLVRHYLSSDVHGLIFMVDSQDRERISDARDFLHFILSSEQSPKPACLLIMANKRDLDNVMSLDEIAKALELESVCDNKRPYHVVGTVATTGQGLDDAFKWLAEKILKPEEQLQVASYSSSTLNEMLKSASTVFCLKAWPFNGK